MATLPQPARDLLDGHRDLAVIATLQPDGRPQQSPVWVTRDGDDILFSTLASRQKPRNLGLDSRIGLLMWPRDSPYTYLEVRGTASIEPDPPGALIDELSRAYTGEPWTQPNEERVIVRITADKVLWRA